MATSSMMINSSDIKPAKNVVKLVTGRNIDELSQSEIANALRFYYDCIRLMNDGKVTCYVAS
jgi:hypothetical protein